MIVSQPNGIYIHTNSSTALIDLYTPMVNASRISDGEANVAIRIVTNMEETDTTYSFNCFYTRSASLGSMTVLIQKDTLAVSITAGN
ncbi:MAG: hypothetical protein ACK5MR_16850 [Cumulibacter sp.]